MSLALGAAIAVPVGILTNLITPRTVSLARSINGLWLALHGAYLALTIDRYYRTHVLPHYGPMQAIRHAFIALSTTSFLGLLILMVVLDQEVPAEAVRIVTIASPLLAFIIISSTRSLMHVVKDAANPLGHIQGRIDWLDKRGIDISGALISMGYELAQSGDEMRLRGYPVWVRLRVAMPE